MSWAREAELLRISVGVEPFLITASVNLVVAQRLALRVAMSD
jgi:type II secretory ATPase GspE/PulE/Tfp pilus assembly ATPase PilB-like protein